MVSIVGNWWKHRFQNLLTKMCLQIRLAKVSFQQCSVFPLFHYNVMLHKGFITNKTSETQIKVSQTCFSGGWQCTDRMTHYKYHRFIAITKMAIFCPRGRGMLHQWSISCHHVSQKFINVFTKLNKTDHWVVEMAIWILSSVSNVSSGGKVNSVSSVSSVSFETSISSYLHLWCYFFNI